MMGSRFIVGLDIGTAAVKVAVAERKDGRPALRALFKVPSAGLRKGAVVELSETASAVSRGLMEVRHIAKAALKNIYVNIGTPHLRSQSSRGIVAVSRADSEIYQEDIDRAIKASQAISLGPNRMVVHTVTREYIVDGVGDITDPMGLSGNRLEISSLIIDAFAPHVKSVMRAVEMAGGQIGGIVADPLPAGRSVLSKHQKELGVLLVDHGFGTTAIGVYEEGKLSGIAVFPVGAGHVTNDLAVGLKIPVALAEQIKIAAGSALPKEVGVKETVNLGEFSPAGSGMVSRRFVAEIIESRFAELCEFINNELRSWGKASDLPGGAVLTGGGAKLPGVTGLVKQELKLSGQIGIADGNEWALGTEVSSDTVSDPEYAGALGLVLWGADREHWHGEERRSRLMRFFRNLLP